MKNDSSLIVFPLSVFVIKNKGFWLELHNQPNGTAL